MVNRWRLVSALACGLLGVSLSAEAQRPVHVPRLGFLGMDSQMQAEFVAAFREGLRALGYVDGRTIAIEYR